MPHASRQNARQHATRRLRRMAKRRCIEQRIKGGRRWLRCFWRLGQTQRSQTTCAAPLHLPESHYLVPTGSLLRKLILKSSIALVYGERLWRSVLYFAGGRQARPGPWQEQPCAPQASSLRAACTRAQGTSRPISRCPLPSQHVFQAHLSGGSACTRASCSGA